MIKFFRKIRYDLMEKNKTVKYLKYAFGEIVLVVIGILIALQLNNANENWKKDKLRQELLLELKSSIMADTVRLNVEKNDISTAFVHANKLKKVISENLAYTKSLDSSFAKIALVNTYEADYKTLERLLNIGIEIIGDKTLIEELLHYYDDSKNSSNIGDKTKMLLNERVYPNHFISYLHREQAIPEDFEKLKKSNDFRISLDYSIAASNKLLERSIHRKNLAIEILKMLNENITLKDNKHDDKPYVRTIYKNDSIDIAREMEQLKEMINH